MIWYSPELDELMTLMPSFVHRTDGSIGFQFGVTMNTATKNLFEDHLWIYVGDL
jgi:hypothetical protein